MEGVLSSAQEVEKYGYASTRHTGLPCVLSEDDFVGVLRAFVDVVRSNTLALKPGATVFLEKTPTTSLHVDLFNLVLPGANSFISSRSQRHRQLHTRCVQSRGASHISDSAESAIRLWIAHVRGALTARGRCGSVHTGTIRRSPLGSGGNHSRGRLRWFRECRCDAKQASRSSRKFRLETRKPGQADTLVSGGEVATPREIALYEPPLLPEGRSRYWLVDAFPLRRIGLSKPLAARANHPIRVRTFPSCGAVDGGRVQIGDVLSDAAHEDFGSRC